MNSKVTGEGDEEVKKTPLQFSAINSDFWSIDMKTKVVQQVPRINI